MKNENALDASFLDIATNMLAIVIIVTMFALFTVKAETAVQLDPMFEDEPALALRNQPPVLERPLFDYYIVFDGRIARWNQEYYVERLAVEGLGQTIEGPDGKLRLSKVHEPRDIDSFSAAFVPDFDAMRARATAIDPETIDRLVVDIGKRFEVRKVAANFVVYPSGMDAFEQLYRRIRTEPVWLRWYLWSEEFPVKIDRRNAHFASFEFEF